MTGAAPPASQAPINDQQATATTPSLAPSTTAPSSGAVPAQYPARSYATATKTATPPTLAGASAPAQHAKPASDGQMNGAMAQGGSQPNTNNGALNGDHGRKPSVVINASGATGQYPNGGPVQTNGSRPAINFGSMNAPGADSPGNAPFHQQNASLQAARQDPRITSPAHSPSPIPPPPASVSGGRPPSIGGPIPGNGNLAFGSIQADTEMMRGQMPQGNINHDRRPSGHSMQSENSSQGMNMGRPSFNPQNSGRGRGFVPNQPYSPAQNYRTMPGQPPRPGMPPFAQQPPGSPFNRQARASPVPMQAHPHMPPGHNPYGQQGYPQHLYPQGQQMYGMPQYDPNQGYYPPYGYYQQPPQSPRPQYPSPFQGGPGGPPYHPPGTPSMVRTSSQASERPSSSLGQSQTPAQNATPAPSHTPNSSQQQAPGSNSAFVKPKKSNAIKITDAQGNAINFAKPSTPSAQNQPQTPVIVSTPNVPTPPPRVPSAQHSRVESKSTKSADETKLAFAEQVKRQAEENKRKELEAAKAKQEPEQADAAKTSKTEEKVEEKVEEKAAPAQPEETTTKAASKDAEPAPSAPAEPVEDEAAKKKREDEEFEKMIAEMEAAEREEEERQKAYEEKKAKQKAEQAGKEAERAKAADEELKRQEREAEAREEARERERNGEKPSESADESDKALFAKLKKPEIGPGASATASGTETPDSEGNATESETPAAPTEPAAAARGGQKPKPAHLKLETTKQVERAEPTPGMQALKSARFLTIQEDAKYPDGFKSPNPALNQAGQRKGRAYDKEFLLQFQNVFKEKPSMDWDQKVKDTLGSGDEPGSARGSARTPSGAMGSRQNSGRPANNLSNFGAMGQFSGGAMGPRTLPAGTTSQQRFEASQGIAGRPGMPGMTRVPSSLGMGAPGAGMSRTNSVQQMGMGSAMSPRQPSGRGGQGRGGSRRDDRVKSRREEADMASKMPLTAGMDLKPLEKSKTGWQPTSITGTAAAAGPDPSGNMAPDLVQRKVKAALNKMTPEKFDKISDQILEIAAQSKNETDGRTLRQVIQLTFEKACDEAHWAGMYAKFCHKMLTSMSPEIRDETIRDKSDQAVVGGALFRKYLLNRCQEEFERGWQANLPDKPEGDSQEAALLSDDYYIAAAAKRKGLGLIQFIGQLYKLRMLTLRIMHECVMRLLNFEGDPDEAAIETLTTLLKSVGGTMMEDEKGPGLVASYFQRIDDVILKSDTLASRPRFMILDLVDLRKAGWKGKDDSKGPKTIQQIHEEAEAAKAREDAERQKSQRGGGGRMPHGRGDARNFSGNMPPPQDYAQSTVRMDDLRKLQARGNAASRPTGSALGPGGGLGPSMLGARGGSRRGAGGLAPGSSGTSRTNTPPVDAKKEEPTQQNAFSALAALDASGDQPDEQPEAASPPAANRSKSPTADES